MKSSGIASFVLTVEGACVWLSISLDAFVTALNIHTPLATCISCISKRDLRHLPALVVPKHRLTARTLPTEMARNAKSENLELFRAERPGNAVCDAVLVLRRR